VIDAATYDDTDAGAGLAMGRLPGWLGGSRLSNTFQQLHEGLKVLGGELDHVVVDVRTLMRCVVLDVT